MIVKPRELTLRDGRSALLDTPDAGQANALLQCARACFGETDFLSRYPEEFTITPAQEVAWIENARSSPDIALLICTAGDEMLGNAQIDFSPMEKTRHRAVVSLCVRQSCWGLGVGTALFTALMELARQRGVEIVELAFVEGNDRARKLYEKFGFAIVCEKPRAYKLRDGSYRKEITMQCRL